LAVRLVSPVIPIAQAVRKLARPARTRQFLQPAGLAPLDVNPGSARDRRGGRADVRRPDLAAARMASIPWVVVRTFLRRA